MSEKAGTVKVNFNFSVVGLNGKPIFFGENGSREEVNAGKMLANILSSMSKGDVFKLMEWSRKAYHGEDIELNKGEKEALENHIKDSENLTVLSKEQLLNVLKSSK